MSANVTVLTDELGLQREYREIKRNARDGEMIKVVAISPESNKNNKVQIGEIFTVEWVNDDGDVIEVKERFIDGLFSPDWKGLREYIVLEPTNIVHVNGERFRLVERKANVGERVVITHEIHYARFEDVKITGFDHDGDALFDYEGAELYAKTEWYRVLEPLTSATPEQPMEDSIQSNIDGLIETVANLARRLSEAETQLRVVCEDIVLIEDGVSEEIIEKAKADVAELMSDNYEDKFVWFAEKDGYLRSEYVQFIVNRNKRTVVALVRSEGTDIIRKKGIAKCAPNDVFNVHIGKAIALRRALGLDIPLEYVSMPHPDEPQVGDYVEYEGYVVKVEPSEGVYYYTSGSCAVGSYVARNGRILDDSRDGRYGEVYSV